MNILILYASKYGCTEDCANYLKEKLRCETEIVSLHNLKTIDLQSYEEE